MNFSNLSLDCIRRYAMDRLSVVLPIVRLGIAIVLLTTAARADWRDDLKKANAASVAGKKAEAADLFLKVARDPGADIGERWAAIVNGVPMEPGRDKELWALKGDIAATMAKQADSGNAYWQAAGAYQHAGQSAEMLKSFRKAARRPAISFRHGRGVFVAVLPLSRDLEVKGDLAGAASLVVSQMDRMGDHLSYALDRLNEVAVAISIKTLTDKKEAVAIGQPLPLVEALKTAEKTGRGLPEALEALGIKLPADFAQRKKDVLAVRDKALADKKLPNPILPWQVEWYAGMQSAQELRSADK